MKTFLERAGPVKAVRDHANHHSHTQAHTNAEENKITTNQTMGGKDILLYIIATYTHYLPYLRKHSSPLKQHV